MQLLLVRALVILGLSLLCAAGWLALRSPGAGGGGPAARSLAR
jgi:hypothetical protein